MTVDLITPETEAKVSVAAHEIKVGPPREHCAHQRGPWSQSTSIRSGSD